MVMGVVSMLLRVHSNPSLSHLGEKLVTSFERVLEEIKWLLWFVIFFLEVKVCQMTGQGFESTLPKKIILVDCEAYFGQVVRVYLTLVVWGPDYDGPELYHVMVDGRM